MQNKPDLHADKGSALTLGHLYFPRQLLFFLQKVSYTVRVFSTEKLAMCNSLMHKSNQCFCTLQKSGESKDYPL